MSRGTMLTVPDMVEGGLSVRMAVIAALEREGYTLTDWCEVHKKNRTSLAKLLGGEALYADIRDRLCETLAIDREWLDAQLDTGA